MASGPSVARRIASLSGKSGAVLGVCRRRTESNEEPLTCEKFLTGSDWVWAADGVGSHLRLSRLQEGAVSDQSAVEHGWRLRDRTLGRSGFTARDYRLYIRH
jgi:hypothetical protein